MLAWVLRPHPRYAGAAATFRSLKSILIIEAAELVSLVPFQVACRSWLPLHIGFKRTEFCVGLCLCS